MKLVDFIIGDSPIDEDEREIIEFGVERLITVVVASIIVIIIGFVLHELMRTLLLIMCLLPLRQNAGGFHLSNKWVCAVASVLSLIGMVLLMKCYTPNSLIMLFVTIVASFPIVIFAPVGNLNRELDLMEKKVFGNRAKTIWIIEILLFLFLFSNELTYWCIIISFSVVVTGILVFIGKIQESILEMSRG